METIHLLAIILTIGVSTIGYFLKQTMEEIKTLNKMTYKTSTKLEVLETDYINKIERLDDKFDMLYKSLDKLVDKIDNLTEKIIDR